MYKLLLMGIGQSNILQKIRLLVLSVTVGYMARLGKAIVRYIFNNEKYYTA